MYGTASPSLRKRGHMLDVYSAKVIDGEINESIHLKTPTLLAKAPILKLILSCDAVDINSVNGINGRSIVFSWTWKENKKKDIALVKSACNSTGWMMKGTAMLSLVS